MIKVISNVCTIPYSEDEWNNQDEWIMNSLKFIVKATVVLVIIGVPVILFLTNGTNTTTKGEETVSNDIVIPPIDASRPAKIATATFAMG